MVDSVRIASSRLVSLLVVLLLSATSLMALDWAEEELNEQNPSAETSGRQTADDLVKECEGITFEDMFVYTHAIFDITIADDWKSADIWGLSWVNGSDAAEVRKDIDELMAKVPGNEHSAVNPSAQGNDGMISTDERDALEDIGSACIEKTSVRFAVNDVLHRDEGDWNNMSWVGDSLLLSDEQIECVLELGDDWDSGDCPITMVETDDPTYGDCSDEGRGDGDCQWVDITSEQNFVLWVHGTTQFTKIDHNSFTMAINSTNVSSAKVRVTYPPTDPVLRQTDIEVNIDCDATVTKEDDDTGEETTWAADCLSSSATTFPYTTRMVNGGQNFQFETDLAYDFSIWPATQHLFFDFTTAEPDINDPPTWTATALADGGLIPILANGEEQVLFEASSIESWYSDDYSAAQIQCELPGWNAAIDAQGDYTGTPPVDTTTETMDCELVDGSDQVSVSRSFTLAQPLSISTASNAVGSSVDIDVTPQNDFSDIGYNIVLSQGADSVSSGVKTLSTTSETVTIATSDLSPGEIDVSVVTSGVGVLTKTLEFELVLTKASIPPILTVDGYEWLDRDGDTISDTYTFWGTFSDPDGENVDLTITVNGEAAGGITITGSNWEADGIPFYLYEEGEFTVIIEACDASGDCTSREDTVTNLFHVVEDIGDISDPVTTLPVEEGGLLPAPGLITVVAGVALALFVISRRDENEASHR